MKKILIIEDNLAIRGLTAEMLNLADYQVLTAENGKKGVEIAKSELPDLILCDIMMPDLDGYGVLRILSKNPDTVGIPFIFITSKNSKSDLRKGMNLGADDYLFKPVKESDLIETIESRLKRSERIQTLNNHSYDSSSELNNYDKTSALSDLADLSKSRKEKLVLKKEKVYQENDYSNYVYFLVSGRVKCIKIDSYGKEYITDIYVPGNFFGYMPLRHESEYYDTAIALEDSNIAVIPKRDFLSVVEKNKYVSSKLIEMLSENIREKESRLLQLAYAPVRERVAEAILKYKNLDESNINSIRGISRDDLASIVGTTKESLVRILTEFKKDGVIESDGRDITILNENSLKRTASGC